MATPERATLNSETDPNPTQVEALDITHLGAMLRERRGPLSIRQAAAEADVSFSTLARVEAGAQPDLATFTRLCAWLGVPPGQFFAPVAERDTSPLEEAVWHIGNDPRLTPEAVASISNLLKDMYRALAKQESEPRTAVACHLRASNVMRPGVPDRLASILQDMHDQIVEQVAAGRL